MYCDNCGNKLLDSDSFCEKCGRKVNLHTLSKDKDKSLRSENVSFIDPVKGAKVAVGIKCSNCGHTGKLKKTFTYYLIGILWLITTIWGGFIYFIFASPHVCENCKKRDSLTKILNDRSEKIIKASPKIAFYILNIILLAIIGIPSMVNIYGDAVNNLVNIASSQSRDLESFMLTEDGAFLFNINNNGVAPAVVNILCPFEDEIFSLYSLGTGGSGVLINESGLVITNAHIFEQDEDNIYIHDRGCLVILPHPETGGIKDVYIAEPIVYEMSNVYDLAYLEINGVYIDEDGFSWGQYPRDFPMLLYDSCTDEGEIIKLGDVVTIHGYPSYTGGYNQTITEGIISSFTNDGLITTSAKIDSGNSGGLAIDKNGCMIGIPVAVQEGSFESIGYIIPGNLIDEFMDLTLEEE